MCTLYYLTFLANHILKSLDVFLMYETNINMNTIRLRDWQICFELDFRLINEMPSLFVVLWYIIIGEQAYRYRKYEKETPPSAG